MKKLKIVLASRNEHKIRVINAMLGEYIENVTILSLDEVGLYDDVEETGSTFEENAMIKARAVSKYGYIGVADDSGLSVDALSGFPVVCCGSGVQRRMARDGEFLDAAAD